MKIRKNIKPPTNPFASCITLLIVVIGVFLRFYNLNWGSPFYFHPDERNIASAISQLSFPQQMNPHFFAYGSLPIYSVFFLGLLQHIQNGAVSFENSIVIGRILSAILSVGVLFLVYRIGLMIGNIQSALIAVCLAALSVGYIQYAHFSTFEMWLSFLTLLLTYSTLQYVHSKKNIQLIIIAVELGLLTSVKISSLIFLPLILFIIWGMDFLSRKKSSRVNLLALEKILLKTLVIVGIGITTVFVTSPFFWLDNNSFRSSIQYEADVATGKLPVFYTQGFLHAVPVLDPIFKSYPFLLNPVAEFAFIFFIPFLFYLILKRKSLKLFLLFLFLLATFFSQTVLYVQWTRYYIPTLGFIYILLGYGLNIFVSSKKKSYRNFGVSMLTVLLLSSSLYTYSYARTVLFSQDSRVEASRWATKNLSTSDLVLSEIYDMGIVPFNSSFHNIQLFNFYELENDESLPNSLQTLLSQTTYVILPSERIINTRVSDKKNFPIGYSFYKSLQVGNQYKKIYATPCDIYCKILYVKNPWFNLEETASVFDHPTVQIFKKI